MSRQPSSVLIEDSYFGNNRARGTLLKTSHVLVRNNYYNHTSSHCLQAFPDGWPVMIPAPRSPSALRLPASSAPIVARCS